MSVAGSTQYVDSSGTVLEFDESLSEEERRFYMKAYPTIEQVRDRKTHCTTCKIHIGTAPIQETFIRMHPVLRVTHCIKCHDFYNSGEFSKGEDGSELYCRWCGQGGEVYCCSNCPFVFCKSCIVKNLSKGVVADIEQNENWSCFSCAPKILWPLRAQHWALVNFIEKQKKEIKEKNLTDIDEKAALSLDRSSCCRLAKSKCGNMSDSVESIDSSNSRRSQGSNKPLKNFASLPKRQKTSNDEVVCTPDLMSMLEPDCQITVSPKQRSLPSPAASAPKVLSIQTGYGTLSSTPKANVPPPLVLRNTGIQMRALGASPVMRRPVVGPRSISPINGATTPVYHTINGFRIDLNSAAQQETFRLPNGKLIQVKRQGALHSVLTPTQSSTPTATSNNSWQQRTPTPINFNSRPVQITPAQPQSHYPNISIQQSAASSSTHVPNQSAQIIRYNNAMMTNTANASVNQNGSQIQMINGVPSAPIQVQQSPVTVRPVMVKHVFPDSPIGQARTQLQEEVFTAMDICQHLTSKVQTLTNSNAYKQARNYLEVKELYIHLSYLLTYAIGRFKNLQDKSLTDMRQLGFGADADSLENGQLPAAVDYVCYGQLEDIDLFNTGSNSFHNQVYNYRKSLHANLKNNDNDDDNDDGSKESMSLLEPLADMDNGLMHDTDFGEETWPTEQNEDDMQDGDENEETETYMDDDGEDEDDNYHIKNASILEKRRNMDDVMIRRQETHAYDRKLSRLIEQYPSIWCTRHPDYGNFEVTRKQWRKIASNFKRNDNIKLRWKNIRKRYVRIERRLSEGKRFNGYCDKSTAFLANRDLLVEDWITVDRGDDDSDNYENLPVETILEKPLKQEQSITKAEYDDSSPKPLLHPVKPIEVKAIDLKIISFVSRHPILWHKQANDEPETTVKKSRNSLWNHLWKLIPSTNLSCQDIIDRWTHLYEMYKTFRLKSIKDDTILANLELKYAKYLGKLYFLYKIDEDELKKEHTELELDDIEYTDDSAVAETKLQDMDDDKEFLIALLAAVKAYPVLWDIHNLDYNNAEKRESAWEKIEKSLQTFKRDLKTIKLRWRLATFSYMCLRLDNHFSPDEVPTSKYLKNIPIEDMSFLVF